MLGRGIDGGLCGVRDNDPAARCSFDVDVVDAHAGPADHPQAVGALDQRCVELRRRANDDRVVVPDDRREVRVRVLDDLEALSKKVETRLGDRLANEDARLRHYTRAASRYDSSALTVAAPASISTPRSISKVSIAVSDVVMSRTS